MLDWRIDAQARGTRIQTGANRRAIINLFADVATKHGFEELVLPILEQTAIYRHKMGDDVDRQMYIFPDKKGRELCLRPEGTATVQHLANGPWKNQIKRVWYETRCFRYERPQAGRYREFTQLGVEVLNDVAVDEDALIWMAVDFLEHCLPMDMFLVHRTVTRGLSYYVRDGFEITVDALGAQKQILGGGRYEEGIGFAIGLDRLLLAMDARP